MAYVTAGDIEERLGHAAYVQLTDDNGSGSADLDKVEEARRGAEGEAESYLATRYAVPLDLTLHPELSAVLRSFVLDLVEYRLHGRRPPMPEDVVRRRGEAVAWLRRVATGEVQLPSTIAPRTNAALAPVVGVGGEARAFSRETLRDA